MKNTLKYYYILIFMICLAIFTACGMLRVEEVNSAVLFGKETETFQLNAGKIGVELRKIF